jgi:hypothetical protein
MFQGAFGKTHPMQLDDGGWVTNRLPRLYFALALTAAFTPDAQALGIDLGLALHATLIPAVSSYSISVVYQRQGATIWDFQDTTENYDRVGPALTVGFCYNLYLRFGYLWHVRGNPTDEGSFLISVIYMRDLVNDLVPDKYRSFLPPSLK